MDLPAVSMKQRRTRRVTCERAYKVIYHEVISQARSDEFSIPVENHTKEHAILHANRIVIFCSSKDLIFYNCVNRVAR